MYPSLEFLGRRLVTYQTVISALSWSTFRSSGADLAGAGGNALPIVAKISQQQLLRLLLSHFRRALEQSIRTYVVGRKAGTALFIVKLPHASLKYFFEVDH